MLTSTEVYVTWQEQRTDVAHIEHAVACNKNGKAIVWCGPPIYWLDSMVRGQLPEGERVCENCKRAMDAYFDRSLSELVEGQADVATAPVSKTDE